MWADPATGVATVAEPSSGVADCVCGVSIIDALVFLVGMSIFIGDSDEARTLDFAPALT